MVQVHNSDLLKEVREGASLQQLDGGIPSILDNKIVPVMEVNPKLLRRANIVDGNARSTSGATVIIYTTPSDRDFYLTSLQWYLVKTAACDSATAAATITVVIDGATKSLVRYGEITLTAQEISESTTFTVPIKLDRGSAITFNSGTFTAGAKVYGGSITGYTVLNTRA